MASVEERLNGIRAQQQEAGRRRAQAEAKLDEVQSRRKKLMAELTVTHGCSSVKEAQTKMSNLSAATEAALADIEEKVKGL